MGGKGSRMGLNFVCQAGSSTVLRIKEMFGLLGSGDGVEPGHNQ